MTKFSVLTTTLDVLCRGALRRVAAIAALGLLVPVAALAQPAPAPAPGEAPAAADPATAQPAPIDPATGQPVTIDPATGQPVPAPQIDPVTGLPIDPAAAAPATTEEVIENPYSFRAMVEHGDFVVHGTLTIMAIMSIGSWYIGVVKYFEQSGFLAQARNAGKFWSAPNPQAGVEALSKRSAYRLIAEMGVESVTHREGLANKINPDLWTSMMIGRGIEAVNMRLQGGLAFLATVGSTAPFVGLFGTVWGIYNALVRIGVSGQASIDKVAGPVGEALIMTAIGLAVAVPAVMFYNLLGRRNKVILESVRHFASDLEALLVGSRKA